MATKAKSPAAPALDLSAIDPAMLAALLAKLQAAKPVEAAKAAPATVDHGKVVIDALTAAGGKVVRQGKSGISPNGRSKAWVDVKIGNVRIQGNAFVTDK